MREKWIDNAKVIGIYLVVLGHFQLLPQFADHFIYAFHMPLFFLLSGLLHKPVTNRRLFVQKNFKHLLVPYFYFYVISYIYFLASGFSDGKNNSDVIIKPLVGLLVGVGYSTNISTSVNHPLWFLVALFFVKVLFAVIEKTGRLFSAFIILILVAAVVFLKLNNVDLWFSLDSAILALPFYYLGVLLKQYNASRIINGGKYVTAFYFVMVAVLTYILASFNGAVDMNTSKWGNNIFLFYAAGVSGSFMIAALSSLCNFITIQIWDIIAKNTLIIMCLQSIIKSLVLIVAKYAGYQLVSPTPIIQATLLTFLIIILSLIPIFIINKYFPFIIGNGRHSQKSGVLSSGT
jgi:acyltransferase